MLNDESPPCFIPISGDKGQRKVDCLMDRALCDEIDMQYPFNFLVILLKGLSAFYHLPIPYDRENANSQNVLK